MILKGLGIDIVEIKRFAAFQKDEHNYFLLSHFSPVELKYCFSFKDSGAHLASTWAAKEAVFKALGKDKILFTSLEVRRAKNGQPSIWLKGRQQKSILLSISQTDKLAVAIAIKQ